MHAHGERIKPSVLGLLAFHCLALPALAQDDAATAALRKGRNFLPVKTYTQEEDDEALGWFEGLRVADVSDGMDQVGLRGVGLVSPEIGPLWKDTEGFTHRIIGVAVTARYVPSRQPLPGPMAPEAFDRWVGEGYSERSPESFVPLLREGSVLVIEDAELADVGSIGSNNIMSWVKAGAVGVVTSQSARDTDEIIAQKVPLYFRQVGRGIRPGRNELESVNRPVVVGGVTIMPGDIIVADGDGVVAVPREHAEAVARYAHATLVSDKAARRRLYEELGLPLDDSVR